MNIGISGDNTMIGRHGCIVSGQATIVIDDSNDSFALVDARGGGSSRNAIILEVSLVRLGGVSVVVIAWGFDWRR